MDFRARSWLWSFLYVVEAIGGGLASVCRVVLVHSVGQLIVSSPPSLGGLKDGMGDREHKDEYPRGQNAGTGDTSLHLKEK